VPGGEDAFGWRQQDQVRNEGEIPMKRSLLSVVAFLCLSVAMLGQEVPDWAKRTYSASIDQVFAAALRSIQEQHHEVQSKDDTNHNVEFHVGTTAWSWGYHMRLTASAVGNGQVQVGVEVSRLAAKLCLGVRVRKKSVRYLRA